MRFSRRIARFFRVSLWNYCKTAYPNVRQKIVGPEADVSEEYTVGIKNSIDEQHYIWIFLSPKGMNFNPDSAKQI